MYFGDLSEVFAAIAGALRPNGMAVFTLEQLAGGAAGAGYRLGWHGRYAHARAYVEGLLAGVGLQPAVAFAELRMEAGAPVPGLVVRASAAG